MLQHRSNAIGGKVERVAKKITLSCGARSVPHERLVRPFHREEKMKLSNSIEEIRQTATAMLEQADVLGKLAELDLPGRFVFSPPTGSRLCISSLDELHQARTVLREAFGWSDRMEDKFASCGAVIVTYSPNKDVKLPLPFQIWVEASPESFPKELLGDCKVVKYYREDYSIVCPV
jgi:hypothetical protein